jgi:ubiquinol-cytochrome c reductase cytochrome c subunit
MHLLRQHPPAALLLAPFLVALVTPLLINSEPARAQAATDVGTDVGADVERVYLADCASCHGSDGRGTNRGPTLVDVGTASTYYYLATGRMPIDDPNTNIARTDPAYPPELIEELVSYVEGFGGGGPELPHVALDSADVANGGKLYRSQCASCHATAGAGGALLYQHAPSVYEATPTQTAAAIRTGPGTMPAFGEAALSEEELNDMVAYVDYLGHPDDRGGQPLWHLGPLIEGLAAWVLGLGILILLGLWIGKGP